MFKLPTIPTVSSVTKLAQSAAAAVNLPLPSALSGVPVPAGATTAAPPADDVKMALSLGSTRPSTNAVVYDDLVHYFKFASTAYVSLIAFRANGTTVVKKLFDLLTDTHGYISLDNTRKEIIVAFRGSVSPANFITDFVCTLVDFDVQGVTVPEPGLKVHQGFQTAWKTVSTTVLATVAQQQLAHPDYKIVTVGHSLGGSLASICAVTLKLVHPEADIRMYTYGQPRTGNAVYAALADKLLPGKICRVVNSWDGVPTMVPQAIGYRHHGTEYWIHFPASSATTHICAEGGIDEDPCGSKSIPSTGINLPHLEYFGIPYITPFLL